jgi:hypothetical protein
MTTDAMTAEANRKSTSDLTDKLKQQIAAALTDPAQTSNSLFEWLQKLNAEIARMEQVVAHEEQRAKNMLETPDEEQARLDLEKLKFSLVRLKSLIAPLQARLQDISASERLTAWHQNADALEVRRDSNACRIQDMYLQFEKWAADLTESEQIKREIDLLHMARPAGVSRHLRDPICEAFNVDRSTFLEKLVLPGYYPPRQVIDPAVYGPGIRDTHPGRDFGIVQQQRARERRDLEQKALDKAAADAVELQQQRNSPVWWPHGRRA